MKPLKLTGSQQRLLDFLKRHPNEWHTLAPNQRAVAVRLGDKWNDGLEPRGGLVLIATAGGMVQYAEVEQ
jgi:hypothetical protein